MFKNINKVFSSFLFLTLLGLILSLCINVFIVCSNYLISSSLALYNRKDFPSIFLLIFLAIISFFFLKYCVNPHKDLDASGIVELEREIHHKLNVPHFIEIPLLYLSSFITFFFGFPLGSEGPSVTLGGKLSALLSDSFSSLDNSKEENISLGAAMGFEAAFLSPLSGLFYLFECIDHKFSFRSLIKAFYLSLVIFFSSLLLNRKPLIIFSNVTIPSFKECLIIPFIFVICFILAVLFKYVYFHLNKFFKTYENNWLVKNRTIFFFIFIVVFNLYFSSLMYSGHSLIYRLSSYSLFALIAIFVLRFFSSLLFSSGKLTGGIVIPTMCLGAIVGQVSILIFNKCFSFSIDDNSFIILFSMILMFSLINKAPFTASSLFLFSLIYKNRNIHFWDISVLICILFFFLGNLIFNLIKQKDLIDEMLTI